METLLFIQTGMGVDVHGQDSNVAAERAVKNAIHYNSMPGIRQLLPEVNIDLMKVHVKFAILADINQLDEQAIQKHFAYGSVTVESIERGMKTTSGIFLTDKQDNNDLMYIVNEAIEVGY